MSTLCALGVNEKFSVAVQRDCCWFPTHVKPKSWYPFKSSSELFNQQVHVERSTQWSIEWIFPHIFFFLFLSALFLSFSLLSPLYFFNIHFFFWICVFILVWCVLNAVTKLLLRVKAWGLYSAELFRITFYGAECLQMLLYSIWVQQTQSDRQSGYDIQNITRLKIVFRVQPRTWKQHHKPDLLR